MIKRILAVTVLMTMLLPAALLGASTASAQCSYADGTPIQLVGTPHLFIADAQGVLHWGGDTRALAGHVINWGDQCAVSLSQLTAAPRGDPWLTAGLPKIGDPIYLAKWEDTAAAPTLLHIQSIADLELFGINTNNYGNFVLDRATWEQRFGVKVGALRVGPLASAGSFAWSELDRNAYGRLLPNMQSAESAALAQGTSVGTDAAVALASIIVCERGGLATFESGRNDAAALQGTNDCLAGPVLGVSAMAPYQLPFASGSSDNGVVRIESPGANSTASGQRQFSGFAVNCATGTAALQVRIFRGTTSAGVLMNTGSVEMESRDLAQVCTGSGLTGSASVGWTTTVDTIGSPDGMQTFTAVADFPGGGTARDSLSITLANNTNMVGANGVPGCQNGYVPTSTYGCQPLAVTTYGTASICPAGFTFTATGCQMATFSSAGGNCPAGSTYTIPFGCQQTTGTQTCPSGQVAAIAFGCTATGTQQCQGGYVSTALYGCQAAGTFNGITSANGPCSVGSTYINNGCVYPGGVNSTACQSGSVSTSAYGCLPVGSSTCATGMVSTSFGCLAAGATGATTCQAGYYYYPSYGCVHS